jgi:tRNA threonylcarbamoyladenosine biosynthesis protein TsaE
MVTFKINKIEELDTVAKHLIEEYDTKIFLFKGNLGSGKTTLIKRIVKFLGAIDEAISPTFSILNIYKTNNGNEIYHFDLYRIKDTEELTEIGFEDYILSGNYCFIEWPEIVEEYFDNYTSITIDADGKDRIFKIERK